MYIYQLVVESKVIRKASDLMIDSYYEAEAIKIFSSKLY